MGFINFIKSAFYTIKVDTSMFFKAAETDLGKFVSAFETLFHAAPNALQTVRNFVGELAPVIVAAVALADPAIDPEVAAALDTVQGALAALYAMALSINSGQTFLQALKAFAATVPATLKAIDVKNPALKSKIEWIVNFVESEAAVLIPAVEAWVKQLTGQSTPATPSTATTTA